ncbi:helix-turn-helix domain-containing protein [Epilithonimonas pallida]
MTPDFSLIYSDILSHQYPEKREECQSLLAKSSLSALDIMELNKKIFGKSGSINQKYRSYGKSDILHILHYQKKYRLNNSQLANHFGLSRNSVAKWKKMFII